MSFHGGASSHSPPHPFLLCFFFLCFFFFFFFFLDAHVDGFLYSPHDLYGDVFPQRNQCSLHRQIDRRFFEIAETPSNVLEVNVQVFEQVIKIRRDEYTAVLFYAEWCPFSRTLRKIFDTVPASFPTIAHLAVESSPLWPGQLSRHGVRSLPVLLLYSKGKRNLYYGPHKLESIVYFYTKSTGVFPTLVSIKLEGGDVATCSTLDKGSKLSKHEDVCLTCAVAFLLWRFLFPRIVMAIRYYEHREDD